MIRWRSEVQRAKLKEKDLEVGQAIAIYERIQREGFQDKKLDEHLKELREMWATTDAEHEDARNFIYKVWPTLDSSRLKANLPEAIKALRKCKEARDLLSVRKLLKGIEIHADRLTRELQKLHPELMTDHDKPARELKEVSEELLKLGTSVEEFLRKAQLAGR